MIFERFAEDRLGDDARPGARAEGVRTRRGKLIDKGFLYKLLNNRVYIGEAVHKGTAYPGEHAAIISQRPLGQGARDPAREPADPRLPTRGRRRRRC